MWSCFGKSCTKTKSMSPRKSPKKSPSPSKSPARKVVGFTKMGGTPVFKNKTSGKLSLNNGRQVKYVVDRKYPEYTGYYTLGEFKKLASMPNWNF